jgi:tetratricopeptide (TPR) repeat protein
MSDTLFEKAEDLRRASRYREAIAAYRKALMRYRRENNGESTLSCLLALGDTLRMTGDFSGARDAYAEALLLAKAGKKPLLRADAAVGIGLSVRALGEWKEALALFGEARKVYEKASDGEGLAFLLWAEAGAFRVGGMIPQALESFKQARRLFRKIKGDDFASAVGYCLCGLGGLSRVAGKWEDSMAYYTEANRELSRLGDRFGIAYSHCGIGNAFRMRGELGPAMRHLKKAERLYGTIGDIVSYSYTLWSMGMTELMRGRPAAAQLHFEQAARRFRKTKDRRGLAYYRLGKGQALMLSGDLRGARRCFEEALGECVRSSFSLEACHAEALLALLNGDSPNRSCYRRLGSRLTPIAIPFNIP